MTWKRTISLGAIVAATFVATPSDSAARTLVPSNAAFAIDYILTIRTDSPATLWSLVQYYPELGGAATLYNNAQDSIIFQGEFQVNPFPIQGTRVENILYDYASGGITGIESHLNVNNTN